MPYECVRQIEERFQRAIGLIAKNSLNARQLAVTLGVSRPIAQRIVAELKRRGYAIRSVDGIPQIE